MMLHSEFIKPTKPEPCGLVKAFRAVGCEWMEEGVEFEFGNNRYVINGEYIGSTTGVPPITTCQKVIRMLNHPEELRPIPAYSPETVEDAKAALRLGFDDVARDKALGTLSLLDEDDCRVIDGDMFPEIQPGQRVPLKEIVGCG